MKQKYYLNVYCRRNGMTCDAGIQAQGDFETAEDALYLKNKLGPLYQHYDEVFWSIACEDGRKCWEGQ
jgi:hypothetical protein